MGIVFFQFVIDDFQVISDTNPIDKGKIIANKAEKLALCIEDREYYLLKTEAVTVDEYAKLSLSSENTDDSHISPLSSNHCDDSLLTTVSDESECTTAVHVYDLSKRETKILRHDIIKRSRNPIGGDLKDPFDSLGNCCGSTNDQNSQDGSKAVLESTPKHFSNCVSETIETGEIKSIGATIQLRSVHLNCSPRKFEMDNVQLINNTLGTGEDEKDVDELLLNDNHDQVMAENIETDTIAASERLIESERNNVYVESDYDTRKTHKYLENNNTAYETYSSQKFEQPKDNECNISSVENRDDCALSHDPIVDKTIEVSDLSNFSEEISFRKPTDEIHLFKHVQDYARNSDIMVQVSEHKEKSVIEEDVISLLPSVKALAQTFSQDVNKDVSKLLHRPTVRVMSKDNSLFIPTICFLHIFFRQHGVSHSMVTMKKVSEAIKMLKPVAHHLTRLCHVSITRIIP